MRVKNSKLLKNCFFRLQEGGEQRKLWDVKQWQKTEKLKCYTGNTVRTSTDGYEKCIATCRKKKILLTVLYIFNFREHFLRNPILGSSHF